MATHSSILAGKSHGQKTEEPGRLLPVGSQESDTNQTQPTTTTIQCLFFAKALSGHLRYAILQEPVRYTLVSSLQCGNGGAERMPG